LFRAIAKEGFHGLITPPPRAIVIPVLKQTPAAAFSFQEYAPPRSSLFLRDLLHRRGSGFAVDTGLRGKISFFFKGFPPYAENSK
jgi:hypothetical protein